jgi:hypothetical protein
MSYEEEDSCMFVSATGCLRRKRPPLAWLSMEDGDGGWVAKVLVCD